MTARHSTCSLSEQGNRDSAFTPRKGTRPRSTNFAGVLREARDFFDSLELLEKKTTERFAGAGVYGLYYFGDSTLYKQCKNDGVRGEYPIYIGKAVPPGSRRGVESNTSDSCHALWKRIREHFGSIDSAHNLHQDEFKFKAMVMHHPEIELISGVESHLIRIHNPLWNAVVDGFGNHTPGNGRFEQAKSDWDVIHPGRLFADKCRGEHKSEESIKQRIREWENRNLGSR
jgi:hypothetical protein